jgi:uncharacterized membrane protein
MEKTNLFVIARIIHIIGIVLWIGGVAFITSVLIPSIRKLEDSNKRLELFEQLEGRFAIQAKIVILITGLSGLYMIIVLNAWSRYLSLSFWWMHMMTFIWLIFTIVLFILEPLFLHRWFHESAAANSDKAFKLVYTLHIVLLSLSLVAILGAIAGTHGFKY